MSSELDRAFILFEQSRHDLAERELRQELAADPDSATAHALLGLCLAERAAYEEALQEAHLAIGLAPDLGLAHYALASILQDREEWDEAATAIHEAIRLDPEQANYHALLASIRYDQGRWTDALAAAEQGLTFEPEHIICSNLRGMVLVKLGRRAEAGAALDDALHRDPENAVTHANQGWVLLRQGDHVKALEHFRAALQSDPNFEMARQGVVEALKARYRIYSFLLRFFVWMANQSGMAQWALILGGFIGYWALRGLIAVEPELAPWIWTLLTIYLLFGVLTWIAYPLFNLLLKLDPVGRLALTREQAVAANWLGVSLLASLVAAGAWLFTGSLEALIAAAVCGLLVLPIVGTFRCRPGLPRKLMAGYTLAVAAAGFLALGLRLLGALTQDDRQQAALRVLGILFLNLFVVGAFFSGLVTIGLMMLRPKR